MITEQISFIRRGADVRRYHTMVTLQQNTVGHHSFNVAWLAYFMALARDFSASQILHIVMAALAHDLAEQVTGDMPGDAKRAMGLRGVFGDYEDKHLMDNKLLFILTEESEKIVKRADIFEGALFCCSEASLGNRRVAGVFDNYRSYINEMAGEFNETEQDIVNLIDDLWSQYGEDVGAAIARNMNFGRSPEAVGREIVEESLVGALRREEAEGRATPPPKTTGEVLQEVADDLNAKFGGPSRPSEQANLGDTPVPEAPASAPSDAVAQPDLAAESPSSPANARQVGGDHYKGVGYEHWDLVLDTGMNYFQGCATKYVTRWRKHEAGDLNLAKAAHYIDKLQEALAAGRIKPTGVYTVEDIITFGVANSLNDLEVQIIKDIVGWRLEMAQAALTLLRHGETTPPAKGSRAYYGQND